jgi:hypothetical protein
MDYCSTCRRHLNGALVCPGCGAYAPDIAPRTVDSRLVPAAAASPAWHDTPPTWHAAGMPDGTAIEYGVTPPPAEDPTAAEVPTGDVADGPAVPQGRAARRRQLARWKKNQRRAVVATAVALVGGGLTLASLDRHSTDRVQAATAPDDRTMGAAPERATDYSAPESDSSPARRSAPRTPRAAGSPAATTPQGRSVAAAPRSAPLTHRPADAAPDPAANTDSSSRTDTAATSQDSTGVTDTTGTTEQQPAGSAPAAGTDSGSTQSSPAPASSSPTELCVLVLCLG